MAIAVGHHCFELRLTSSQDICADVLPKANARFEFGQLPHRGLGRSRSSSISLLHGNDYKSDEPKRRSIS